MLLFIILEIIAVCEFETPDLCGYAQDTYDEFDWSRNNGGTPSISTGPSADHTFMTSSKYTNNLFIVS